MAFYSLWSALPLLEQYQRTFQSPGDLWEFFKAPLEGEGVPLSCLFNLHFCLEITLDAPQRDLFFSSEARL